jgi:pimeloyl-ACP methyl ester carboxylesterase
MGSIIFLAFLLLLTAGFMLPKGAKIKASPRDRYINVYGSKIRFRQIEKGSGYNYIFLHGFGSSLEVWEALIRNFSSGRLISLDLIGFGGSDRPDVEYSLEMHRKYLTGFMDALKIRQAILIGSSMGASISAWTAARSPDRVQGIVLFAPSGFPGSMRFKWSGELVYRPGLLNRLVRFIAGNFLFDTLFPSILGRQALDVTASYDSAFAAALSDIKQPVLLFWSSGDKRVPFASARAYLDRIAQAELIERPADVGHSIATFAPEKAVSQINDFLKKMK